jgi:hypothetical protein
LVLLGFVEVGSVYVVFVDNTGVHDFGCTIIVMVIGVE